MRKTLATMATLLALITLLTFNSCEVTDPDDENPVITKTDEQIDSLIKVLVTRAEQLEYVEGVDDAKSIEFKELADVFTGIVAGDQNNFKANVGQIVSSILSLNSNPTLVKLADSLDSYFSDMDNKWGIGWETEGGKIDGTNPIKTRSTKGLSQNMASSVFNRKGKRDLYAKATRRDGVNGLGLTLLATMPEVIVSRAKMPSVPKFITVAYIQDAIENEIVPVLNNAITSFENLEQLSDTSNMKLVIDGESIEIDMADIYLVDASIRALRAGLGIFTAYDWDMFTSASDQSYSWVDDVLQQVEDFDYHYINNLSLSGDTITNDKYYAVDTSLYELLYDVIDYNYNNRSSFLTIRKANHAQAFADLKAVPVKLRKALELLEAETDNQEDDVIKKVDISDMKSEMVDIKADMIADSISEVFASHFESPTTLINFAEKILTEPYTFEETIDGVDIKIKVDISKFFTNPVQDFRDWVPLHKFRSKSNIIEYTNGPFSDYVDNSSHIYIGEDGVVNQGNASSIIDSVGNSYIYLNDNYNIIEDYSSAYPEFIDFLDDQGNTISMNDMLDSLYEGKIAYFNDYTLNGIFPEMTTREKWNDFISKMMDLF